MTPCDYNAPWYHGSPERLTVLRKGSWVTQFKEVAKAFSHRPSLMSLADDCQTVKHDGRVAGFLYTVAESVRPDDVSELPGTAHTHWQTERDLRVALIAELPVSDPPLLTADEISQLKEHPEIARGGSGFIGSTSDEESQRPERGAAPDG